MFKLAILAISVCSVLTYPTYSGVKGGSKIELSEKLELSGYGGGSGGKSNAFGGHVGYGESSGYGGSRGTGESGTYGSNNHLSADVDSHVNHGATEGGLSIVPFNSDSDCDVGHAASCGKNFAVAGSLDLNNGPNTGNKQNNQEVISKYPTSGLHSNKPISSTIIDDVDYAATGNGNAGYGRRPGYATGDIGTNGRYGSGNTGEGYGRGIGSSTGDIGFERGNGGRYGSGNIGGGYGTGTGSSSGDIGFERGTNGRYGSGNTGGGFGRGTGSFTDDLRFESENSNGPGFANNGGGYGRGTGSASIDIGFGRGTSEGHGSGNTVGGYGRGTYGSGIKGGRVGYRPVSY